MSEKKSFLVRLEVLGLPVNTFAADYDYSRKGEVTVTNSNAIIYKLKDILLQLYCVVGICIKF